MNPTVLNQYIDLLNKFVQLCSASVPLIAMLLRAMKLIHTDHKKSPNPVMSAFGVVGFGCFGSIIGLCLTVIFGIGSLIFIWLKLVDFQSGGVIGLNHIDWGILGELFSKTNLIFVGASIVSTLITFGGKEQPNGLAFIAGISLGATLAVMFLVSVLAR